MIFRQTLGGNGRAGAALLAAMPCRLLMRDRMVWQNLVETGQAIGQERVLVGLQCEAIIAAAASGDWCNRAAIAVQGIRRHDFALEGSILCEHARVIQRSHQLPPKTIYDWRHYLAVVQRKPGALRNGAPFLELPPAFRQLQDHMLRKPGGDREMVDILALVLHHDEQAVLAAVELALAEGVPTKTHVLNLLHRLVDGKVVGGPPLDTPQALALHREPQANVERYDGLRAQIAGGRHAS